MTAELWVPGVVVLVVGAAIGWWVIRKKSAKDSTAGASSVNTASGASTAGNTEDSPSDSLAIADLKHRRDELYSRLRAAGLDEQERRDLELEAARILQELDRNDGRAANTTETARALGSEETTVTVGPAGSPGKARTLLTGFAFGGGTVALIALLVFWAGRDATEKDQMAGGPASSKPSPSADQPHPAGVLAPEVAAEVDQILAHLESKPDDMSAHKRLALLYLGSDQYMLAFEQAETVLAGAPDDIDSLYVEGVVRMTMGQDERALAQLDRVLELFPDHVRAMTVKGLIAARRGDRDRAEALWNRALEVGGPQPQVESLLAMLAGEESGQLPPGHPPAGSTVNGNGGSVTGSGTGLTAPGEYRVRVEAQVIPGFPQTGTLFVALRSKTGGPPIAVKRVDQPTFPLLVSLGSSDRMMAGGAELPESGTLTIRLDQDGSVSTRGENDLEGTAEMSKGDLVTVVLH